MWEMVPRSRTARRVWEDGRIIELRRREDPWPRCKGVWAGAEVVRVARRYRRPGATEPSGPLKSTVHFGHESTMEDATDALKSPLLEMADGDAPARGDDVVLWPAWGGVPEVFETATQVVDIACTAHEVPRLRWGREVSLIALQF